MSEKVSASLSVSIREALPEKYSLRRNLRLMAMTFFRPRSVIEFFGGNTALPYILLPLVAFTALFEVGYMLDYFLKAPGLLHFLGRSLGIPDATYNLYQIFLVPVVNIVDFLLYAVVLHAVSRLLRIANLDTAKATFFFAFIWHTIGLPLFFTEYFAMRDGLSFLWVANPLQATAEVLYVMEFIHHLTRASRWRALISSTLALVPFLGFRLLFVG